MNEGMSIADAMALKGDGNGWGDNGLIWLVVLFLFGFGGFGGQHGFGGAATAAAQNEILAGQQFDAVHSKLNDIGKGICDSTYDLNNSIKDCCCNAQLGIAGLNAKIDQQTGVFTAMLKDAENQRLRDRIGSLELKDAMCGVVRWPMGFTYSTNCNPFCPPQSNPCGYGCGNNGF